MLSSEGSGISVWSATDPWDSVWSSSLMAATPAAKIPGPACARHRELFDLLSGRDRATPDRSESGVSARRQSGVPRLGAGHDRTGTWDLGPGSPSTKRSAVFTPRRDALFATMGAADKITPQARGPDRWEPTDRFVQFENRRKAREAAARRRAFHEKKPRLGDGARRQRSSRGPKDTLPKFARSSAPPRSAFLLARKRQ